MTTDLAARLRTETSELHRQAERSPFMATLLRGAMGRDGYVALLAQLRAVYGALEPALRRHAGRPALDGLDLEGLARRDALSSDLDAFGASSRDLVLCEPTVRYVARIAEVDAHDPDRLLAHAYVRYLGDLAGGQVLRRIVSRTLTSPTEGGTAFYDFGDAQAAVAKSNAFRELLAAVTVEDDAIVDEARRSFIDHRAIFDALAAVFAIGPVPGEPPAIA